MDANREQQKRVCSHKPPGFTEPLEVTFWMQDCINIVVLALLQDLSTSYCHHPGFQSEVLTRRVVEPAVLQPLPEWHFAARAYSFLLIIQTPHLCELDNPMKVDSESSFGDECRQEHLPHYDDRTRLLGLRGLFYTGSYKYGGNSYRCGSAVQSVNTARLITLPKIINHCAAMWMCTADRQTHKAHAPTCISHLDGCLAETECRQHAAH